MGVLSQLQEWYVSQCDGNWEHGNGVRIETIDNPGWMLRIDLSGTELQDRPFARVTHDDDGSWADIQLMDGAWQAACDPAGLEDAILAFLGWAGPGRSVVSQGSSATENEE